MSRKDIIIISVFINAGLLMVLLISALTSKESYFIASSAKIAESILEKDKNGMLPSTESGIIKDSSKVDDIAILEKTSKDEDISKRASVELKEDVSNIITQELFKQSKEKEKIVHKLPSLLEDTAIEKRENKKFMEVIVQKGDTLEKIAKNNHTTINEIIKINELPNSFLRIGQLLLVPKIDRPISSEKKVKVNSNYYTVKCGDNPWTIAMKHHMKVEELLKLNNLDNKSAKRLRPGDKLKIR